MSALRPSPRPPEEPEYDPERKTKPGHLAKGPLMLTPNPRNKRSSAKQSARAFIKHETVTDLGWKRNDARGKSKG